MKTISAEIYVKEQQERSANDIYRPLKPQYELVDSDSNVELDENEIIDEELDNEPTR
jgi:proteasome assembly chaperone (PAC2) family protein